MRRASSRQEEEETELNMTPMLDVVFILLIFFIVTAVFVKEPGIDPERPEVVSLNEVKPSILIAVSDEDEIWINKQLVAPGEVRTEIDALRGENPKGEAIIQGDQKAKFSVIYNIMEALQEAGVPAQYVSADPDSE